MRMHAYPPKLLLPMGWGVKCYKNNSLRGLSVNSHSLGGQLLRK